MKSVSVLLKSSAHEEQMESDGESPAEIPVLSLRLNEEEEKQTLELDEGFEEFDSGSNEAEELLKEKKVVLYILFFLVYLNFKTQNFKKSSFDSHGFTQDPPVS